MGGERARRRGLSHRRIQCAERRATALGCVRSHARNRVCPGYGRALWCNSLAILSMTLPAPTALRCGEVTEAFASAWWQVTRYRWISHCFSPASVRLAPLRGCTSGHSSSSDSAKSTNESRQSIRQGFLLVRLEFCQQALMSFRQTPGQTRGLLVPCITQMQSEHPRIVKIAHPLHPSPPLQVLDEATHRTFLEVQLLCQHLLRHRCLGGERHQREHLGERDGEAGRHLVGPVQS